MAYSSPLCKYALWQKGGMCMKKQYLALLHLSLTTLLMMCASAFLLLAGFAALLIRLT